jgi:hypothetical protein
MKMLWTLTFLICLYIRASSWITNLALKTMAIYSSEMSVSAQKTTSCHKTEDLNLKKIIIIKIPKCLNYFQDSCTLILFKVTSLKNLICLLHIYFEPFVRFWWKCIYDASVVWILPRVSFSFVPFMDFSEHLHVLQWYSLIHILDLGNSYWQNAPLHKSEGVEEWIAA